MENGARRRGVAAREQGEGRREQGKAEAEENRVGRIVLDEPGVALNVPRVAFSLEPLLTRPLGRPSNAPLVRYADFSYQSQSWNRSRRVVAKVEWHKGELFPSVGFIVTNLTRPAIFESSNPRLGAQGFAIDSD